jgi:hypothetical protein
VTINVLPVGTATLIVAKTLTRQAGTNAILLQVTVSNTGDGTAGNVVINTARIGAVSANTLPVSVPDIPPNSSQSATLLFPAINISGTPSSLTLGGTWSGGSINYASRIVLP